MLETGFGWLAPLLGGGLIGAAALLLMGGVGRIAGISGIVGGALDRPRGDTAWRWLFLGALIAGAGLHRWVAAEPIVPRSDFPVTVLLVAGLLVGVGTRLGSGCTSGHGVCGLARLSPRSLVATATFMGAGLVTVWLVRHGIGGW
jgi:uncharacterized membrane protein YedE/YeeE